MEFVFFMFVSLHLRDKKIFAIYFTYILSTVFLCQLNSLFVMWYPVVIVVIFMGLAEVEKLRRRFVNHDLVDRS